MSKINFLGIEDYRIEPVEAIWTDVPAIHGGRMYREKGVGKIASNSSL